MGVKTFTLRLNDEQHQYLEQKSNELGITKNDYIRQLINGEISNDKQDKILSEIIEIKEMLKSMEK
jgi:predicted DNA-binding protein